MTNNYLDKIISGGLRTGALLLLPEYSDERIQKASSELKKAGFNIVNIDDYSNKIFIYKELLYKKKFTENWPEKQIDDFLKNPINLSMVILENGDIDGLVAGAINNTSDVIRSAIRIVGIKPSSKWVSSTFFLLSPDGKNAFTYSDCGVIPEPTSEQLAFIANEASNMHYLLTDEEPRIAFLSFSTKGSAEHYKVEKVKKAAEIFGKKYPNILHEGEIQFDVAFNPLIAEKKLSTIKFNKPANVFIFPDLDSGNISYKITEQLAGYLALGPLLNGLNKPIHDLSRGCSIEDIFYVAAITACQKDSIHANV